MTGGAFVLLGQMLGLAFAAGLNLYATVALLGLAGRLGWIGALPPELRGLQHPIIIYSAAALYVVEFVVDKLPRFNTLWDTLHTIIRPAAAATLAVAAVGDVSLPVRMGAGILAGGVALLSHGTKAGIRLTLLGGRGAVAHSAASVFEDVLAVGLAGATLRFPFAALGMAAAVIASTLPVMPRLSRAFVLGIRGVMARVRGLLLGPHWRDPREVPRALRALLDPQVYGFGTPSAARVGVRGLPGVGAYRNGWLIMAGDQLVLLYHRRFRAHILQLPPGEVSLERGFWADMATIRGSRLQYIVYFLKDGPAPELPLAQLAPGEPAHT